MLDWSLDISIIAVICFSFVDLLFSEISLKMKYCEILFDLENIFDILIRAAS